MNMSTNVICIPFWKRKHLNVIPTWTCSKSKCTMVVAMSGTRTPTGVWCGLWTPYRTGNPERREIPYYVNPWCWMTLRDQHVPGVSRLLENIGNHSKAANFSDFVDFMMFPVSTCEFSKGWKESLLNPNSPFPGFHAPARPSLRTVVLGGCYYAGLWWLKKEERRIFNGVGFTRLHFI